MILARGGYPGVWTLGSCVLRTLPPSCPPRLAASRTRSGRGTLSRHLKGRLQRGAGAVVTSRSQVSVDRLLPRAARSRRRSESPCYGHCGSISSSRGTSPHMLPWLSQYFEEDNELIEEFNEEYFDE